MARISVAEKKKRIAEAVKSLRMENYQINEPHYLRCGICGKWKSTKESQFIMSNSKKYSGFTALYYPAKGKNEAKKPEPRIQAFAPYCKSCREIALGDDIYNMTRVMEVLVLIDKPYLREVWNNALRKYAHKCKPISLMGHYVSNVSLNHDELTFKDSEDLNSENGFENEIDELFLKKKEKAEAVKRWGTSWSDYELSRLQEFYYNMKRANKIETPQDEDYLRKITQISVKIDTALDTGVGDVKKLGDLYSKYMQDSKFRAMDMTSADKQGGLRSFSQIYEEVESPDFIPPWEKYSKFLNVKQDIVDKVITFILNFNLKFANMNKLTETPDGVPSVEEGEE